MSGFAGLVGPPESTPVPPVVEAMAAALAPLGPDRRDRWQGGPAFLAHSLLATTEEETADRQPLSFDGVVHLVADARIDGRNELIERLRQAGRAVAADAPDSALILHAWHAWGETAPERLIGDFAFAIWDSERRVLFAARDQFGSVPFYFARAGETLLFGNAVPALLAHPDLDRSLNPTAIGDYLMFGYSLDRGEGFHRHIGRLPSGHSLSFSNGEIRQRRYWSAPEPQPDAPGAEQAIEAFEAALTAAVRDRVRGARIATTLSGGMDSTLLTALAMRNTTAPVDAYSFGGDWLTPDTERHWAWRCAHHLGVPFHPISVERIYTDSPGGIWRLAPEPRMEQRCSSFHLIGDRLAQEGTRVLLMGMGGDAITSGGASHWAGLIRDGRYGALLGEALAFWSHHRVRPPLRTAWNRVKLRAAPAITAPLDPAFAREHRLEERWRDNLASYLADPRGGMANHPFWTEMFVASHPESSGLPLRVRQPFFDVRLLEAAMRLPPTPWQFGKAVLRRMGEGLLPDDILRRPKTPFGVNAAWEAARRGLEPWFAGLPDAVELDGYVDRARLARIVSDIDRLPPGHYSSAVMLPASLAAWLRVRG